ncbi:hypothetical protein BEL07_22815 [Mycolicibacterium grossiae]|uniref:Uncharacterized protein n=1 Tax=Mycolicibacterium grossiae TaxID=1552759 RepID=A0A1E8PZ49_9MYCO|nr:hypothetical protein BEL07_22815 [Mycolicibacterium grossiae]
MRPGAIAEGWPEEGELIVISRCDAEMCPLWDGETCPCDTFGLDRANLPVNGTFVIEQSL